jgi:hypothetical protein
VWDKRKERKIKQEQRVKYSFFPGLWFCRQASDQFPFLPPPLSFPAYLYFSFFLYCSAGNGTHSLTHASKCPTTELHPQPSSPQFLSHTMCQALPLRLHHPPVWDTDIVRFPIWSLSAHS